MLPKVAFLGITLSKEGLVSYSSQYSLWKWHFSYFWQNLLSSAKKNFNNLRKITVIHTNPVLRVYKKRTLSSNGLASLTVVSAFHGRTLVSWNQSNFSIFTYKGNTGTDFSFTWSETSCKLQINLLYINVACKLLHINGCHVCFRWGLLWFFQSMISLLTKDFYRYQDNMKE